MERQDLGAYQLLAPSDSSSIWNNPIRLAAAAAATQTVPRGGKLVKPIGVFDFWVPRASARGGLFSVEEPPCRLFKNDVEGLHE